MLAFCHSKVMSVVAFIFIGIGWVTINSIPFTIFDKCFRRKARWNIHWIVQLLDLLATNLRISCKFCIVPTCLPKMSHGNGSAMMILFGAIFFIIGAFTVWVVKETKGNNAAAAATEKMEAENLDTK